MGWNGMGILAGLHGQPLDMHPAYGGALVELVAQAGMPEFAESIRLRARSVVNRHFAPFCVRAAQAGGGGEGGGGLKPGQVCFAGAVAIVPVIGPLAADAASVTDSTGERFGTTYDEVREGVDSALASPTVSAVLLYVDSPGGEAAPSYALVDYLRTVRSGDKPIGAYVATLGASAALHVAGMCTPGCLMVAPGAMMGSIGSMLPLMENSKALAEEGITVNLLLSPTKHAAGASFQPLGEADRAMLQAMVDRYGGMFVRDLADGRGVTEQRVAEWARSMPVGEEAVRMGLADAVAADLPDAVARMNAGAAAHSTPSRKYAMNLATLKSQFSAVYAEAAAEGVAAFKASDEFKAAAAAGQPATLSQLKALPGADPAFVLAQAEAGATVAQATAALCTSLGQQLAAVKAELVAASGKLAAAAESGAAPIQNKGGAVAASPSAVTGTVAERFEAAVKAEMDPAKGADRARTRATAVMKVRAANPALWKEYCDAGQPG